MLWNILNEMLREVTGRPDYIFNPKKIMVDENGANYCGVQEAIGITYMLSKLVGCKFHFKNSIQLKKNLVSQEYRQQFVDCCLDLCKVVTVDGYNLLKGQCDVFCQMLPTLKTWVD